MKKDYITPIFTLAFLLLTVFASAQELIPFCGTKVEDLQGLKDEMMRQRQERPHVAHPRGAVTYVPVRFYMVANNDGSGRVTKKKILDALCMLNKNFEGKDIQFYIKEMREINNSTIYNSPDSQSGVFAISNQIIYNAINIFVTGSAGTQGVLGFWQGPMGQSSGLDYIDILISEVAKDKPLTHEVGHFFSLNHPFFGWENSGGWDPMIWGVSVGALSPDGQTFNEKVSGSNCETAADGICDTPPDYLFWNFVTPNCNYTGNAQDPDGVTVDPILPNFMNYLFQCGDNTFTDGQVSEMQNGLFLGVRNYVRPPFTPNTAEITERPLLLSPIDNEITPGFNTVILHWDAVAGADKYLVELAQIPVFNGTTDIVSEIVGGTSFVVDDLLDPGEKYFWRVKPFNDHFTCADFSLLTSFTTGSTVVATTEINAIDSWQATPNPVQRGASLRIEMNSSEPFEAMVTLVSMEGRVVNNFTNHQFEAGASTLVLPVNDLAAGLYALVLRTNKGVATKRIVIME